MLHLEININTITVYGVGRGNAPAHVCCVGHLRTVFSFLNTYSYEKHFQRSHRCDSCPLI